MRVAPPGLARLEEGPSHVPLQQVDPASALVGQVGELMDQQALAGAGQVGVLEVYREPIKAPSRRYGWKYGSVRLLGGAAVAVPLARARARVSVANVLPLHAFQKKSTRGTATPQKDIALIWQLAVAERDYREGRN